MKRSMVFHRGLLETKMEEIPEVTKKLAPFAKKQSRNIIMEKKIRKRYHSEEAVKKALKIESFRNLTKDKVMEFTSMIPYMEKEVALEIIKQFPVYVEFVESAIENYTQLCKTILETNKEEYEMQEPTPYDIIQMADAYGRPDLCNYYCSHKCEIGHRYVPEVEVSDLSNIILETIASLNEINPLTTRLIQIARDGKISDDEIKDFAFISNKLDEISLAIDSLNLWVDKTAGEQGLNIELLREEKKKQK